MLAGCPRGESPPSHSGSGESPNHTGSDEIRVDPYDAAPFVTAVAAGRAADAHALLCEPVRQHLSLDAFTAAVAANPYLANAKFDEFRQVTRWGAGQASGTLRSPSGDIDADFYFSLVGPRGPRWCITGALIGGTPLLPAPSEAVTGSDSR